ncbi:MAG: glycosyltransferase family A protein [Acidimicrobiia bacterium]
MSVITPVYNGARYLVDAVTSVERQDYEPFEIIVVDDGSTDETPRVIAELGRRVRAFRQGNGGPAAARNRGIAEARGELLAFCDADDAWPDGKLDLQVGRLQQDPELAVVLGRVQYIADGVELPNVPYEDPDAKVLTHVHLGSGVYRRSAFERVGSFDATLRFSEDVDWFYRARELRAKIRILPDVTLYYRVHRSNMTRGKHASDFELTAVLKRSVDRRKAAGREGVSLEGWRDLDDVQPAGPRSALGEPTVSVIIPVFDETRYLAEAIDSALAQTHRPVEIIVVDDGSDEPVRLPDRLLGRVIVVRSAHRGQGAARNLAAARARGELLAFLDADDVWLPDKLEHQVAALGSDDSLDMCFGYVEEFFSPDLEHADTSPARMQVYERRGALPSTFVVRTRAFRRVGKFREDVVFAEFIDWYARATEAGVREVKLDRVVARRRIHDRNAGILRRDLRGNYAQVLKDALDRRRAGGAPTSAG